MKFNRRGSGPVKAEDRRGQRGVPGGVGGAAAGVGGIGAIIAILIALLTGGGGGGLDIPDLDVSAPDASNAGEELDYQETQTEADRRELTDAVFANAEAFWADTYAAAGSQYRNATRVLYDAPTQTGCGVGSPDMGPFYCGADEKVYLELGFLDELANRFGATGDFAWAYVVAHELGHHIQTLSGISQQVQEEARRNPDQRNELSVRQELQADCLAGVWANSVFYEGDASVAGGIEIDESDITEAVEAARAVGDDRIQQQAQGRISPESFTHGTSEQRERWFRRGFATGNPADCEGTFTGNYEDL